MHYSHFMVLHGANHVSFQSPKLPFRNFARQSSFSQFHQKISSAKDSPENFCEVYKNSVPSTPIRSLRCFLLSQKIEAIFPAVSSVSLEVLNDDTKAVFTNIVEQSSASKGRSLLRCRVSAEQNFPMPYHERMFVKSTLLQVDPTQHVLPQTTSTEYHSALLPSQLSRSAPLRSDV